MITMTKNNDKQALVHLYKTVEETHGLNASWLLGRVLRQSTVDRVCEQWKAGDPLQRLCQE